MSGLTPEMLLHAYACGVFPMAESADSRDIYWVDPDRRGVLPLERFHVPRRLRRTVAQDRFRVTIDQDFRAVIEACAAPAPGRSGTWINREIIALYCRLHERGGAHSVECWQGESLAGGLYGVELGGAFFGESM
ncbi:MAG: leucyl/phenylalanyl-tRNA--protein transferase, partial [Alphaproteobacteria bacterium]